MEKARIKMISAKEAYELADTYKDDIVEKQLREIENHIQKAVNIGRFSVCYRKPIRNECVEKLREYGYNVEKKPAEFNDIYYAISWMEAR
jgi:hypothetical protein